MRTSFDEQTKTDLHNVATLEDTFFIDNGRYTTDVQTSSSAACKADTADICYLKRANAGPVTAVLTDAAGAPGSTDGTHGYCLRATSDSGTTFFWNSVTGGLNRSC